MSNTMRDWQKAHMNIWDAEASMRLAKDLTDWVLKNDRSFKPRPLQFGKKEIPPNPSEVDVVNINHTRDERMGMVVAYCEKYYELGKQIDMYERAKNELTAEIEGERNYFNSLYHVRKRYPIQDALLLPEFKSKTAMIKSLVSPGKTLYCHVIKKPDLYYPKTSKNYYNKVLLIQGPSGTLEYRCHPSLRKSLKVVTTFTFTTLNFHRQTQTFTHLLNHNNTNSLYMQNPYFIQNLIEKLKFYSLYNWLQKEFLPMDREIVDGEKTDKKDREAHTRVTQQQYELIKDIEGLICEPYEGVKSMTMKVNLCRDISIEICITITEVDYDGNIQDDIFSEFVEKEESDEAIVKHRTFIHFLEWCICRENSEDLISLDLMAFLSQRYIAHLLNKVCNLEMGLSYEYLYSEPIYFKYHINHLVGKRGTDSKIVKRTTIIVLEVEAFKLMINVKTKTVNDSEYVGTFQTKPMHFFTKDLAEALALSLE